MQLTIKLRRGSASEWTTDNPTLASGEPGFETDTKKLKIGDGIQVWNDLDYFPNVDDIVSGVVSVDGRDGVVTLNDLYASSSALTSHTGNVSNPHSVTKAQVGLSTVDNTADTAKPVSTATQTALDGKADLVGGFVPTAQLPALAITDVFTVASQSAMLALTAEKGDVALRTDTAKTYILSTNSPSTLADWKEIPAVGVIQSINGQTGVVVLAASDVGAVPTSRTVSVGSGLSGGGDLSANRTISLDSDLVDIAALSPTNDDIPQRKAGAWTNRTPAQFKTDLSLVKGDVGLGNVDNTADTGKPVSTAQQTALDLKADLAGPSFTGGVTVAGKVIHTPVNLTDAAPVTTDASLGTYFRVTFASSRTLANPTNPTDGQRVIWEITQGSGGSKILTLDTKFLLGSDLTTAVLSTTAGKVDLLGAIYNSTLDKWLVVMLIRGF